MNELDFKGQSSGALGDAAAIGAAQAVAGQLPATLWPDWNQCEPSSTDRECQWCREQLPPTRPDARFCGRRCRQAAFRIRRRYLAKAPNVAPLTFAYADPPYPGLARRHYGKETTFGGEVDHAELVQLLTTGFAGWALSTSARSLRAVLPLCPEDARVCSWVKPIGVSSRTSGIHNTWEPLIVVPGRRMRPGTRDFLIAQPARSWGTLMGRKPLAFCAWLFELLGMLPGDTLNDLFPGTGIVGRAWGELSPGSSQPSKAKASTVTSTVPDAS